MKILKRAINSIISGILGFMILCVLYKLIAKEEQWLAYALFWTFGWMIGDFIAGTVSELRMTNKKIIWFNISLIFIVSITLSFLLGCVIQMSKWFLIVSQLSLSLGISLFVRARWRTKYDDESSDVKRERKEKK